MMNAGSTKGQALRAKNLIRVK